jgi:hypothetical protein
VNRTRGYPPLSASLISSLCPRSPFSPSPATDSSRPSSPLLTSADAPFPPLTWTTSHSLLLPPISSRRQHASAVPGSSSFIPVVGEPLLLPELGANGGGSCRPRLHWICDQDHQHVRRLHSAGHLLSRVLTVNQLLATSSRRLRQTAVHSGNNSY